MAALVGAACSGPEAPTIEGHESAIIGGVVTTRFEASGIVSSGSELCSGTLVAPTIALTAAHCIYTDSWQLRSAANTEFGLGPESRALDKLFGVISITIHPSYTPGIGGLHDLALLTLDEPATVAPAPLYTGAPAVGNTMTLVGYGVSGVSPPQGRGVKREVDVTVSSVEATRWRYEVIGGRTACSSDSGGSAYIQTASGPQLAGVVAVGGDSNCTTYVKLTRIDVHTDFIPSAPAIEPPPTSSALSARVVGQSPAIGQVVELAPGSSLNASVDVENTGTQVWRPGETLLGTTQPRDAFSPLASTSWPAPNRAATIDRVVEPGQSGRFLLSLQAPMAEGEYWQLFNLVQSDGRFFDAPNDDVIRMQLRVVARSCSTVSSTTWVCLGAQRARCVNGFEEQQSCPGGCVNGAAGAECATSPTPQPATDLDGDGSPASLDCDDSNPAVYPGAVDLCDGYDQDCDGYDNCSVAPDAGATMRASPVSTGCSVGPTSEHAPWLLLLLFGCVRRRFR